MQSIKMSTLPSTIAGLLGIACAVAAAPTPSSPVDAYTASPTINIASIPVHISAAILVEQFSGQVASAVADTTTVLSAYPFEAFFEVAGAAASAPLTLSIDNRFGAPLSVFYNNNVGGPTPVRYVERSCCVFGFGLRESADKRAKRCAAEGRSLRIGSVSSGLFG